MDGEFFFNRWNEVEKWIEQKVVDIKGIIHHSDYENKTEVILMLEGLVSWVLDIVCRCT